MAAKNKAQALVERITGQEYDAPPEGFTVRARAGNPFPEPGASIEGTYSGPGKTITVKGKTIETFTVTRADGEVVSILAASQISEFFASVAEGDQVWIQYQGQIKGGKGRVNVYRFATKPGTAKSKRAPK